MVSHLLQHLTWHAREDWNRLLRHRPAQAQAMAAQNPAVPQRRAKSSLPAARIVLLGRTADGSGQPVDITNSSLALPHRTDGEQEYETQLASPLMQAALSAVSLLNGPPITQLTQATMNSRTERGRKPKLVISFADAASLAAVVLGADQRYMPFLGTVDLQIMRCSIGQGSPLLLTDQAALAAFVDTLLLATGRTQQTTTAAIQAQVSPACITDSDLQIMRCSIGQGSPLLLTEQAALTAFVNTLLLATGRTQQTTTAAIQAQVSPACITTCARAAFCCSLSRRR